MPIMTYILIRSETLEADLSEHNDISDAVALVDGWVGMRPGRNSIIQSHKNHELIVDLEWDAGDVSAGTDLHDQCVKYGIRHQSSAEI